MLEDSISAQSYRQLWESIFFNEPLFLAYVYHAVKISISIFFQISVVYVHVCLVCLMLSLITP